MLIKTKQVDRIKRALSTLLIITPLFSLAQQSLSLEDLIEAAVQMDAELKIKGIETQYTDLERKKLRDIFLPRLELAGGGSYLNTTARFTSPEINLNPLLVIPEGRFSNDFNISGFLDSEKLELKTLLYSGGKVKHLKRALGDKKESENIMLEKSRYDVICRVSEAYDQLALVQKSKEVLQESQKRLEINKKTADKALKYGLITTHEHKKIELAQSTLEVKINEYEGKRELLLTHLEILSGIAKGKLEQIEVRLKPIEHISNQKDIQERPEIKALKYAISASEHKIKSEKTWWIPKLQFSGSVSRLGLHNTDISSSDYVIPPAPLLLYPGRKMDIHLKEASLFPIFSAGIGFKWDLFDANEGKHEIEKAKLDKAILETKEYDIERKLRLNLVKNKSDYQVSLAQVKLKEKQREIAEEIFQQAEKEFRYGLIKLSQLIEAKNDLESADLEYQSSIFNQRRAAVELMRSTWELDVEKLK